MGCISQGYNAYSQGGADVDCGLPTGGCSDWDYTTRLLLRHRPVGLTAH